MKMLVVATPFGSIGAAGGGLGDVGVLGNVLDEFCFVHKKPLYK